ncbi:MAG: hypothetical protein ACTS6G_04350 [Candidatus Hodgkinia cicadicola]
MNSGGHHFVNLTLRQSNSIETLPSSNQQPRSSTLKKPPSRLSIKPYIVASQQTLRLFVWGFFPIYDLTSA